MQFELPGTLALPDGRYLARDGEREEVLVVETLAAPPPPRRRRRKPKDAEAGAEPTSLPLTRVTAVRAHEPFEAEAEAAGWLEGVLAAEDEIDATVDAAIGLLNRAQHAQAVAAAESHWQELRPERAARVLVGHGSGEQVAAGRFVDAREVDLRGGASRRRRRDEELRPQERLAAILGSRESADTCETLLLRARADLDAGRMREAALQLRVALEALLVELDGALTDADHEADMAELAERRKQAGDAANAAITDSLSIEDERRVTELTELCERVLRRRRVLRG
ncbi:MAG TPA: hypothetical protein VFT19_12840 [Solirubrobacterales bacterium]|nr:hypothetical protein [Solirubrobacterales bacterium]